MYIVRANQLVMNALMPSIRIRTAAFSRKSFSLQLLSNDGPDRVHTRPETACQAQCPRKPLLDLVRPRSTPCHDAPDATPPGNRAGNSPRYDRSLRRSAL